MELFLTPGAVLEADLLVYFRAGRVRAGFGTWNLCAHCQKPQGSGCWAESLQEPPRSLPASSGGSRAESLFLTFSSVLRLLCSSLWPFPHLPSASP